MAILVEGVVRTTQLADVLLRIIEQERKVKEVEELAHSGSRS